MSLNERAVFSSRVIECGYAKDHINVAHYWTMIGEVALDVIAHGPLIPFQDR